MSKSMTVAQAKARFSEAVRKAEAGEAVIITRRGKAVAALVRAEDLEQLDRLRAAGPEAGLVGLAGGWEGSEELVEEILQGRRSPPRPGAGPE